MTLELKILIFILFVTVTALFILAWKQAHPVKYLVLQENDDCRMVELKNEDGKWVIRRERRRRPNGRWRKAVEVESSPAIEGRNYQALLNAEELPGSQQVFKNAPKI